MAAACARSCSSRELCAAALSGVEPLSFLKAEVNLFSSRGMSATVGDTERRGSEGMNGAGCAGRRAVFSSTS